MPGDLLLRHDRDGLWTLPLNRPGRMKVIDPELWVALADALTSAEQSSDVRRPLWPVVVAFCGGEVGISAPDGSPAAHEMCRPTAISPALQDISIPTIARVTVVAAWAGWILPLARRPTSRVVRRKIWSYQAVVGSAGCPPRSRFTRATNEGKA